jgi:anti-anti-sigma factor
MNINVEVLAGQVYGIAPQGRLDAVTVPDLDAVFDAQLGAGHVQLVLDLTGVTYLSSSGLRALLRARKLAQAGMGDVVLCGMTPRVREVFEMIGFTSLFQVFGRAAEAAAGFIRPATA